MKKTLRLATNLPLKNQIVLFINTGVDLHSICLIVCVNLTNVVPQNMCPAMKSFSFHVPPFSP